MPAVDETVRVVPIAAWGLGFAGATPFAAGAVLVLAGEPTRAWALPALLAYAAVILAFMGGVRWGAAMAAARSTWPALGAATVPALVGWAGALVGGGLGLALLAMAFLGLLAYDEAAGRAGTLPAWYPRLRRPLTAIVVPCLLIAALA